MDEQRPPQGPPAGRKIVLPSSGLAEDILSNLAAYGAPQAATVPAATPAAPGRIQSFAERLRLGQGDTARKSAEQLETWVTVTLGEETYGLPVTHVQEILRVGEITKVPHAPPAVRGVVDVRGRVFPVVDVRVRLAMPAQDPGPRSRILVVGSRGRTLGLLVDAVRQVIRLNIARVQQPPPDLVTRRSRYLKGVHHLPEGLVMLLDVDELLILEENTGGAPPA